MRSRFFTNALLCFMFSIPYHPFLPCPIIRYHIPLPYPRAISSLASRSLVTFGLFSMHGSRVPLQCPSNHPYTITIPYSRAELSFTIGYFLYICMFSVCTSYTWSLLATDPLSGVSSWFLAPDMLLGFRRIVDVGLLPMSRTSHASYACGVIAALASPHHRFYSLGMSY
ncbi:hypothetical protein BDQ17DRAFT_970650 [Cyathus striatus]|nr:hypothetical protein BDQ17DRAFT_970650 [Cyathus striatus]